MDLDDLWPGLQPIEPGPHVDLPPSSGRWFRAGDPVEVLVAIGPQRLTVAEPRVDWDGPGTPVLRARDPLLVHLEVAPATVARTVEHRRRRFRTCTDCEELLPPEHVDELDGATVCHGCMERNHGVVF